MGDRESTSTTQLLAALLTAQERIATALEGIEQRLEGSLRQVSQEVQPHPREKIRTEVLWTMFELRPASVRKLAKLTDMPHNTLGRWPEVRRFYGLDDTPEIEPDYAADL